MRTADDFRNDLKRHLSFAFSLELYTNKYESSIHQIKEGSHILLRDIDKAERYTKDTNTQISMAKAIGGDEGCQLMNLVYKQQQSIMGMLKAIEGMVDTLQLLCLYVVVDMVKNTAKKFNTDKENNVDVQKLMDAIPTAIVAYVIHLDKLREKKGLSWQEFYDTEKDRLLVDKDIAKKKA